MGIGKFAKTDSDRKVRTGEAPATTGAGCARLCLPGGDGMAAD